MKFTQHVNNYNLYTTDSGIQIIQETNILYNIYFQHKNMYIYNCVYYTNILVRHAGTVSYAIIHIADIILYNCITESITSYNCISLQLCKYTYS